MVEDAAEVELESSLSLSLLAVVDVLDDEELLAAVEVTACAPCACRVAISCCRKASSLESTLLVVLISAEVSEVVLVALVALVDTASSDTPSEDRTSLRAPMRPPPSPPPRGGGGGGGKSNWVLALVVLLRPDRPERSASVKLLEEMLLMDMMDPLVVNGAALGSCYRQVSDIAAC